MRIRLLHELDVRESSSTDFVKLFRSLTRMKKEPLLQGRATSPFTGTYEPVLHEQTLAYGYIYIELK
jgi:hypothetical protein